jgi:hypothetical protein
MVNARARRDAQSDADDNLFFRAKRAIRIVVYSCIGSRVPISIVVACIDGGGILSVWWPYAVAVLFLQEVASLLGVLLMSGESANQ